MGATNTTANYNLSQFIGTDKPAWLQDYNGDMLKIDTGINAAKVAADGAQNSADAAQNDATTANNAITNTINPAISALNTTVGNQGGSINTITSLIGNGTPTTTDQTIIGAINEINAKVNYDSPDVTITSGATWEARLNALFAAIDVTKLSSRSIITVNDSDVYHIDSITSNNIKFSTTWASDSLMTHTSYIVKPTGSLLIQAQITSSGSTLVNSSSDPSSLTLKLYY